MGTKEYYSGCIGCVDHSDHTHNCEYLKNNGHVRPCKAGPDGCALYSRTERERSAMSRTRQWDTERARALLEEGHSPLDVANMVGASVNSINAWRRKEGIEAVNAAEPAPIVSDAEDAEDCSDPYVYKGDMSAEEFQAVQEAACEDPEGQDAAPAADPGMSTEEDAETACMDAAALAALLTTAAENYSTPVILLPDGTPVCGCRVEVTYNAFGEAKRVEIHLA